MFVVEPKDTTLLVLTRKGWAPLSYNTKACLVYDEAKTKCRFARIDAHVKVWHREEHKTYCEFNNGIVRFGCSPDYPLYCAEVEREVSKIEQPVYVSPPSKNSSVAQSMVLDPNNVKIVSTVRETLSEFTTRPAETVVHKQTIVLNADTRIPENDAACLIPTPQRQDSLIQFMTLDGIMGLKRVTISRGRRGYLLSTAMLNTFPFLGDLFHVYRITSDVEASYERIVLDKVEYAVSKNEVPNIQFIPVAYYISKKKAVRESVTNAPLTRSSHDDVRERARLLTETMDKWQREKEDRETPLVDRKFVFLTLKRHAVKNVEFILDEIERNSGTFSDKGPGELFFNMSQSSGRLVVETISRFCARFATNKNGRVWDFFKNPKALERMHAFVRLQNLIAICHEMTLTMIVAPTDRTIEFPIEKPPSLFTSSYAFRVHFVYHFTKTLESGDVTIQMSAKPTISRVLVAVRDSALKQTNCFWVALPSFCADEEQK